MRYDAKEVSSSGVKTVETPGLLPWTTWPLILSSRVFLGTTEVLCCSRYGHFFSANRHHSCFHVTVLPLQSSSLTITTLGWKSRLHDAVTKNKTEIRCPHQRVRYVGLARTAPPTNTNFRLTFLLTRLQEALYEDLPVKNNRTSRNHF